MVNQCPALPHEVWINILNRVQNQKQLAACRLVCKQWNPIAEKAMFSEDLKISTKESHVKKLHYHLTRNPAVIPFIKKMNLYNATGTLATNLLLHELLKLVIHPNLEQVSGHFHSKDAEKLFYQTILDSADKLKQLKIIPANPDSDLCQKVYYALRESLDYMYLSSSASNSHMIVERLNEFTNLRFLDIEKYNIPSIQALDSLILDRLKCATTLELLVDFTEENFTPKSNSQMNAWLSQNVIKDERMKTLTRVCNGSMAHWCNLAEYLVYKYPNLEFLKLLGVTLGGDIERILQATKHIPVFSLSESDCTNPEHLWTMGYMLKSPNNTIRIEYSSFLDDIDSDQCLIEEVWRKDETTRSSFNIKLRHDAPHTYIKQLLSSVGCGTSVITNATVDLVHWRDQDASQELLTFYDILKLTPDVQELEFSDDTIQYQKLGKGELMLNGLKNLEIAGAKIDYKVMTQLSSIAPNLDRLSILSSIVVGRKEKYAIIMPHSNLSSLVFGIKEFCWEACDLDYEQHPRFRELDLTDKKMNIKEIMYLCIKTEFHPTQYYVLKANSQVNTRISQEEFALHGAASTTVYIECKSLSSLSFALKDLETTMLFENGVLKSPFEKSRELTLEENVANKD
ncbi:hypothetical protein MBANPS3_008670, partial [Mucor bainieri]